MLIGIATAAAWVWASVTGGGGLLASGDGQERLRQQAIEQPLDAHVTTELEAVVAGLRADAVAASLRRAPAARRAGEGVVPAR